MGGLIKDMTVLLRHSYHDVRLTLEVCVNTHANS